MNKIFEIRVFSDESIGKGFELYYRGEYIASGGAIWLLRKWARECWQESTED